MQTRIVRLFILGIFIAFALVSLCFKSQAQKPETSFSPAIPRTWDDAELASLEVPLATPSASPLHVSADFYYRIPVMTIYKSYPVYAPGKEPPGYIDWLKQQEPEVAFDAAKLKSKEDWIKAGELVFDAPLGTGTGPSKPDELYARDPAWYQATGTPVSRDGVMP